MKPLFSCLKKPNNITIIHPKDFDQHCHESYYKFGGLDSKMTERTIGDQPGKLSRKTIENIDNIHTTTKNTNLRTFTFFILS